MGPPIGVSRLCGPGGPDKVWGMRLTRWSALCGVVMLAAPLRAGATSCIEPPWASTYDSPLVGEILVPVDARPWLTVGCPYGSAPHRLECSLVSESETIVLTDESIGAGACSLGRDDTVTDYPDYLHRLTPASPLPTGAMMAITSSFTRSPSTSSMVPLARDAMFGAGWCSQAMGRGVVGGVVMVWPHEATSEPARNHADPVTSEVTP